MAATATDAEQGQARRRGLALGIFAEDLGVVPLRERERRQPRLDVAGDRAEVAAAHVRRDIDPAGSVFSRDLVRRRRHLDVRHAAERNEAAIGDRHLQARERRRDCAAPRARPRRRRRRAAGLRRTRRPWCPARSVAAALRTCPGVSPNAAARSGSNRTSILRHDDLRLHGEVDHACDVRNRCAHRLRLCPKPFELRTVNADHDRGAGAGQHFLDSFAQIGEQIAIQPGVAVDDGLDLGNRRLVVDRRVEADPQLREIRSDDLVGDFRPTDVRPKFRTPGTAISSRLARSVMRRIASSEVPGFSTQCIRKSYSRKFGRNSSPRNGTVAAVSSSIAPSEAERGLRPIHEGGQHPPISRLEAANEARLTRVEVLRQEQERQCRRHRERDRQRRKDGEHVRQRQRPEKGARQSLQHEDGHEHHARRSSCRRGRRSALPSMPRARRGSPTADSPTGDSAAAACTMFSTSMIASSTTSPSAMTRPASTIVSSVPPR